MDKIASALGVQIQKAQARTGTDVAALFCHMLFLSLAPLALSLSLQANAEDDVDFDFLVSYNNSSFMALVNAAQDKAVRANNDDTHATRGFV